MIYVEKYREILYKFDIVHQATFVPTDEFIKIFGYPNEYIENADCFKMSNVDMNFDNIIINSNGDYIVFDREWIFGFEIPVEFIVYRAVVTFYKKDQLLIKLFSLNELLILFGINLEHISIYQDFEKNFMNWVYGNNNIFILNKYIKESTNLKIENLHNNMLEKCIVQFFLPDETGYSEDNSIIRYVNYDYKINTLELLIMEEMNGNLRIDIANHSSLAIIKSIVVYNVIEDTRFFIKQFSKETNFESIICNNDTVKFRSEDYLYIFTRNDDPWIILDHPIKTSNGEYILVVLEFAVQNNHMNNFLRIYDYNHHKILEEKDFLNEKLLEEKESLNEELLKEKELFNKKLLDEKSKPLFMQVFVDCGDGFREDLSQIINIMKKYESTKVSEKIYLNNYDNVTSIRLDPLNDLCGVIISKILVIMKDGNSIDFTDNLTTNANFTLGNMYFFFSADSQIYLNDDFSNIDYLVVEVDYILSSFENLRILENKFKNYITDIHDLNQQNIDLNQQNIDLNQQLIRRNEIETELRQKLFEMETSNIKEVNKNNELQDEIDRLRNDLQNIYNSSSWKATRPLRAIKKLFSKGF